MSSMDDNRFHDSLVKELLLEVIEEEIVTLLETSIIEDTTNVSQTEKRNNELKKYAQYFTDELLNKVLNDEFNSVSVECFDNIIKNHRTDLTAVQRMNDVLHDTTQEIVEEIILEVLEEKGAKAQCEKIADNIIAEVLAEEFNIASSKTLDHYRARVALLQYKQMQSSASGILLDKVLLNALLLPFTDDDTDPSTENITLQNQEGDQIMNQILLDIVLSQTLALHACYPKHLPRKARTDSSFSKVQPSECLPLNWYKKKVTSSIAEDVAVTLLCERLDESMQFAAEEQMKNQAASLFSQFIIDS